MVWHIKKTSIMSSAGTVYYKGNNCWTEDFSERATYTSQAKAKARGLYLGKKTVKGGMSLLSMKGNEKFY